MDKMRTIPMRATLNPSIFEEMATKYPSISKRGIEYKQTLSIIGFPSDFDYNEFIDFVDAYEPKVQVTSALGVYLYCLSKMARENGYYFNVHNRTAREIALSLDLDPTQAQDIFNFLIEFEYLYNFDGKITSTIAVRSYEIIQSSRMNNRERSDKNNKQQKQEPVTPNAESKHTSEITDEMIKDVEKMMKEIETESIEKDLLIPF